MTRDRELERRDVFIPPWRLPGVLCAPAHPRGLIVFAHGSGSSRFSPRNLAVAEALNLAGFATLLFDLLMPDEEENRNKVFDIPLLAERLIGAVRWIDRDPKISKLPLGLFGASTGAAAALVASAQLGDRVGAVVSRGGRPDLAGGALASVRAPTLLIVGGDDGIVVDLNRNALVKMTTERQLRIVAGATHLFPEPGAMEMVVKYAERWFSQHLNLAPA